MSSVQQKPLERVKCSNGPFYHTAGSTRATCTVGATCTIVTIQAIRIMLQLLRLGYVLSAMHTTPTKKEIRDQVWCQTKREHNTVEQNYSRETQVKHQQHSVPTHQDKLFFFSLIQRRVRRRWGRFAHGAQKRNRYQYGQSNSPTAKTVVSPGLQLLWRVSVVLELFHCSLYSSLCVFLVSLAFSSCHVPTRDRTPKK